MPAYFWGRDEGALGTPAEIQSIIIAKVAKSEKLQALMARLPEHQYSPYDALPPSVILPAVAGAVLRGRFNVFPEFVTQAKRAGEYQRALEERTRLLEEISA